MTTRRRLVRAVGFGVLVAFALLPNTAGASPSDAVDLALEWRAPGGCPSRDQMEARILQLVGAGARGRRAIRANAVLVEEQGAVRGDLSVTTSGETSSRHVEGDSCDAVADAFALIIAVAVDRDGSTDTNEPSPPVENVPPRAESPARAAEASSRRAWFLGASARLDVASLPAPAFGGELAIGFHPPHLSLEIAAAMLASSQATVALRPERGADVRLTEIGGRGCWEVLDASVDFGPCAGFHARWLSASGFGADDPRDATAFLGVASFGAMGRARLSSRLSLRGTVEGAVPLARASFVIDNTGLVYQADTIGLRTALGLNLDF